METPTLGLGHDAITEAEVYLVLYCEARLASYTATPTLSDASAHLDNVDSADNCRSDFATSLPHQVLRVYLRQGSGGLITERMFGTWTASGGGERLARTPKIALAKSAYVYSEGKVYADEPGELSTLKVTLGRSASETMELASPEAFRNGWADSSGQTANATAPGRYESNSMIWAAEMANAEPLSGLLEVPSGFARFTEPGEGQRAQLALLVAGLALGIGASLFVEFVLSPARRKA